MLKRIVFGLFLLMGVAGPSFAASGQFSSNVGSAQGMANCGSMFANTDTQETNASGDKAQGEGATVGSAK